MGPQSLESIFVTATNGQPVPLSSIATVSERRAPLLINHVGQFPAATISFNLGPGASLGEAVKSIEQAARDIQLPLAIELQFQGAAHAFRASLSSTLVLILAAIVTMYIVLGILYESSIHPITILSTLPSAAVGALLALWITGRPLDMIAVIGIILLIGLVKKNGIMMIDFALEAERRQHMSPRDAIRQAALLRFRPILMTTLAALFGALPLMLSTGSGAELRQPLGLVMVGGLLVSQVLTLFTTPVVYLFFDRLARGARRVRTPKPAPSAGGRDSSGRAHAMNLSRPFIRRPVASALIAVGVVLLGTHGVRTSAGGAVAGGGFPHDPSLRSRCPAPVPRQWRQASRPRSSGPWQHCRHHRNSRSNSRQGQHQHHARIRFRPRYRRRGPRCAGGAQCRARPASAGHAAQSELSESESLRRRPSWRSP